MVAKQSSDKLSANSRVIATRTLKGKDSKKPVSVKLWAPVQVDKDEWSCAFHITGMRKPAQAFGIDAFQSLGLALEGIRIFLSKPGARYTWHGGEEGDAGFPQAVPQYFGMKFATQIARLIAREERAFGQKMRSKARRQKGRR